MPSTKLEIFYCDLGSYGTYIKLENLFYDVLFETPFSNARVSLKTKDLKGGNAEMR